VASKNEQNKEVSSPQRASSRAVPATPPAVSRHPAPPAAPPNRPVSTAAAARRVTASTQGSKGSGNASHPPPAPRPSPPPRTTSTPTRNSGSRSPAVSRRKPASGGMQVDQKQQLEIAAIVLVVIAVLIGVALQAKDGAVIGGVGQSLQAAFGTGAWLLPLVIGALAVAMVVQGGLKRRLGSETWAGLLLLVLAAEGLLNVAFSTEGGGAVGAFIGGHFKEWFSAAGAFFLLLAIVLIGVILTFQVSLGDMVRSLGRVSKAAIRPSPTQPPAASTEPPLQDSKSKEREDSLRRRLLANPTTDITLAAPKRGSRSAGGRVSASDFERDLNTSDLPGSPAPASRSRALAPTERIDHVPEPPTPLRRPSINLASSTELAASNPLATAKPAIRLLASQPAPSDGQSGAQLPLNIPASKSHNLWLRPSTDMLERTSGGLVDNVTNQRRLQTIIDTLASFGVPVTAPDDRTGYNTGPAVTQFLIAPGDRNVGGARDPRLERVRVAKIVGLANDLALALAAPSVRIEAPVPNLPYVGVEVPNPSSSVVGLRETLESEAFQRAAVKGKLLIPLGKDTQGRSVVADLTKMPHLLVGGSTGSGKSVCLNSIIASFIFQHTPETLRMLMIDPKRVELTNFNGIPHLLRPVVTELKRDKDEEGPLNRQLTAVEVLKWALWEMERRYKLFAKGYKRADGSQVVSFRNIEQYHNEAKESAGLESLPYIVIIIDELADLMLTAPEEVETSLCRLAQLARATGLHLIIATQSPRVDVVTGLIKANFPARIAFAVTSMVDSRVILDTPGAEKLLGRGDMLYSASDDSKMLRIQGTYVSDKEVDEIVIYWRQMAGQIEEETGVNPTAVEVPKWMREIESGANPNAMDEAQTDEAMLKQAIQLARKHNFVSTSLLQRKLRVGFNQASKLIDLLEQRGIVGPSEGGRPRSVLLTEDDGSVAEIVPPVVASKAEVNRQAEEAPDEDDEEGSADFAPPRVRQQ